MQYQKTAMIIESFVVVSYLLYLSISMFDQCL